MLRVSEGKAIAAFVPCPECQTLSVVHFPKGGKRQNTPYISCVEHKTIQTAGLKDYVNKHSVSSLSLYAAKYKADVSKEQEQLDANKYPVNPELLQRINGEPETGLDRTPEPELEIEEVEPNQLTKHFEEGSHESLLVDESGEVIEESKEDASQKGGSILPLLVILGLVAVVGGGIYLISRKHSAQVGGDDE